VEKSDVVSDREDRPSTKYKRIGGQHMMLMEWGLVQMVERGVYRQNGSSRDSRATLEANRQSKD
jgi:hypothetical protein